jgi:hypothetical protein
MLDTGGGEILDVGSNKKYPPASTYTLTWVFSDAAGKLEPIKAGQPTWKFSWDRLGVGTANYQVESKGGKPNDVTKRIIYSPGLDPSADRDGYIFAESEDRKAGPQRLWLFNIAPVPAMKSPQPCYEIDCLYPGSARQIVGAAEVTSP